jgi:phage terminase small subunit
MRPLQARFVEECLIDLNGSEAARRAGYSKKTADRQGSRLLRKPLIAACIDQARQVRSRRTGTTSDWVLQELRANYEKCIQKRPVLDRQGGGTGIYRYDPAATNRALELIGKHLGMFHKGGEGGGGKQMAMLYLDWYKNLWLFDGRQMQRLSHHVFDASSYLQGEQRDEPGETQKDNLWTILMQH